MAELLGISDSPDVRDPPASDVEGEHRHGDAVLLSHQPRLAVHCALHEPHVGGSLPGEIDQESRDLLAALDRVKRRGSQAAAVGDHGGIRVEQADEGLDVLGLLVRGDPIGGVGRAAA